MTFGKILASAGAAALMLGAVSAQAQSAQSLSLSNTQPTRAHTTAARERQGVFFTAPVIFIFVAVGTFTFLEATKIINVIHGDDGPPASP